MQISYGSNTRHLCVIGDPIRHSLSPVIYNALFARYGIDALYHTMRVGKGELPVFLPTVKMLDLVGFNATMPHKVDLLPLLDALGESAKLHESVNTVVVHEGKLIGHSTDARGFFLSVAACGFSFVNKRVLLLGAGGAGAAIALQSAAEGAASLNILTRDPAKASALAGNVAQKTGMRCATGALDDETLNRAAQTADVVVNATPLGMEGTRGQFASFSFLDSLPSGAFVCELIYKPAVTELMAQAAARGIPAVGGIGMLICQAFAAFEHYYGMLPGADERILVEQALKAEGYAL